MHLDIGEKGGQGGLVLGDSHRAVQLRPRLVQEVGSILTLPLTAAGRGVSLFTENNSVHLRKL